MQIHRRKLASGLTLQAIEMPGTRAVTTLILVGAGSRFEQQNERGISHFLEHMFFKGAKKYTSPKAVSEAVDSIGGEFNAFTGKEYAGYFVKCSQDYLPRAADVLSDMLLHSRFDEAEITKERGVILEEMAMYLDAPMYQISWDFERLVFGDQSLGWDQIGTKELINSVTQAQFKAYQNLLYTPDNMVITAAGAVNKETLDLLEEFFPFPSTTQGRDMPSFNAEIETKTWSQRVKKTEQYHISLGCRAVSELSPDYWALRLLSTILGGNMSSRMFQNVREQKGLCYSIRTYIEEFTDTGLLTTRAGVKLADVYRAVEGICEEYADIREKGVTPAELEKGKNYLIGKMDLKTEDTESVAHHFGKEALLYDRTLPYAEAKKRINAVSLDQVNALAKRLLEPQNLRFAGIGPGLEESKLLGILHGR